MNGSASTGIGEYLISSRSLPEYRAMFRLTDADLRGRVLDCPGGGASFTATACRLGVDAVAADPIYAVPTALLAERLAGEVRRGSAWVAGHADAYRWDFHGDPTRHGRMRAEAARRFTDHLLTRPGRYVAAALPSLPFPDGAFDLVLSSHLLFSYADRLDLDFHRAALSEMVRVSRGQVRVYPLVDQAGQPLPEMLAQLVTMLAADGVPASVRDVDYRFQRGAGEMLQLEASGVRP